MVLKLNFWKAISVVVPGFSSYKGAIGSYSCKSTVGSTFPASWLDNKSNELGASEKDTLTPSHMSTPISSPANTLASAESILTFKYSETDLMRILKIFLKTKSQEPKTKIPRKWLLKAKIPDVYFGKLHIDYYHFCK